MATIGKLKALNITREKRPGMYGDGGGLYLQVSGEGAKSWIFRYWVPEIDPATGEAARDPKTKKVRGASREMGLGSFAVVTLEKAREAATEYRRWRQEGVDPLDARRARRVRERIAAAKTKTFKECATEYIDENRAGWTNEKHAAQWTATLETYAYPVVGDVPVQLVDRALVMKVLQPIWTTKAETARRVRGRVESVLDWATVKELREGENPARLQIIRKGLPKQPKRDGHHPALPYDQLQAFLASLRAQEGVAARALEYTILTVARTSETTGATPGEIDIRAKLWTVPAGRMKADRDHRIPLSARALSILDGMKMGQAGVVFPGGKPGKPLSDAAMAAVIDRMNEANEAAGLPRWTDPRMNRDIVPHGFRSTFRDWAAERTNFPNEMLEMALAHAVDDKTEAAYRRSDMFDKRRRLMDAWAEFCGKPAARGDLVPMRLGRTDGSTLFAECQFRPMMNFARCWPRTQSST